MSPVDVEVLIAAQDRQEEREARRLVFLVGHLLAPHVERGHAHTLHDDLLRELVGDETAERWTARAEEARQAALAREAGAE